MGKNLCPRSTPLWTSLWFTIWNSGNKINLGRKNPSSPLLILNRERRLFSKGNTEKYLLCDEQRLRKRSGCTSEHSFVAGKGNGAKIRQQYSTLAHLSLQRFTHWLFYYFLVNSVDMGHSICLTILKVAFLTANYAGFTPAMVCSPLSEGLYANHIYSGLTTYIQRHHFKSIFHFKRL